MDGGRARQQRRQRAEQAGAVLPQADHVERVRPQHRRQPRHAVVHRRRQLFQQPAQAALRHGLMGHRDRRQLVDLRDRDLRLDQHGQEEVQALLGRARRLGVLLDQHFDFFRLRQQVQGHLPRLFRRRVSSPASRVSWRSAPPGPRLPVTSATETGFSGPCSGRCRSRKCRIACFIDTIRMSCRPAPIRAPGADRRRSRLPARRPARQPCCRAPVPRDGRDDVERIRQQPRLRRRLANSTRMLRSVCCEISRRNSASDCSCARMSLSSLARANSRAGLSLDSGRWRSTRASASSTCRSLTARRAVAHDLQVIGAFPQQRGPLFGQAFVRPRLPAAAAAGSGP